MSSRAMCIPQEGGVWRLRVGACAPSRRAGVGADGARMISEPQSGNNVYSRAVAMTADADLVLVNAKVITVDPRFSLARAVAARGGRIAMVGEDAQVRALVGPDTRVVDAGGRAVMPGLVDGHAHMDREGLKGLLPSLAGCGALGD